MEYRTKDGKLFTDLDEANAHEAELLKQEQVKVDEQNALKAKVADYLMHNLALSCVTIPQEDGDPVVAYYGCADSTYVSKEANNYVQALIERYEESRYDFDNETDRLIMHYDVTTYNGAVIKKMVVGLTEKLVSGQFAQYDWLTYHCEAENAEYIIHLGKDLVELLQGIKQQTYSFDKDFGNGLVGKVHIVPVGSVDDFVRMIMNM